MVKGLIGWAEAILIAYQSAATVAPAIYTKWFLRFGVTKQFQSDRETQFESTLVAELCSIFNVNQMQTTLTDYKKTESANTSIALSFLF